MSKNKTYYFCAAIEALSYNYVIVPLQCVLRLAMA